jgi:hypothetical protein
MDIRRGLLPHDYHEIGKMLSELQPNELLEVLKGLRMGHDQRRQQEGTSGFLGSDRYLGVAMDRLAEYVYCSNGRKPHGVAHEQQMS